MKIGETYTWCKSKSYVYSTKTFETGYNEVYVSLFDSVDGSPLNAGHLILMMMNIRNDGSQLSG